MEGRRYLNFTNIWVAGLILELNRNGVVSKGEVCVPAEFGTGELRPSSSEALLALSFLMGVVGGENILEAEKEKEGQREKQGKGEDWRIATVAKRLGKYVEGHAKEHGRSVV